MPDVASWEHRTTAVVPAAIWAETWYSLTSWRGFLQSVPGCLAVRLAARPLEGDEIEVHVDTLFEHREQLEAWMEGPFLPRRVFADLSEPGTVIDDRVLQGFA